MWRCRLTCIIFLVCMGANVHAHLMMLDQQLSMLASSSPRPYKEPCRRRPRVKENHLGICSLNTAIDIVHRMYCNEEFRAAVPQVIQGASARDTVFHNIILNILKAYDDPSIEDIPFADEYDMYVGSIASLGIEGFRICESGGASTYTAVRSIVNVLFGKTISEDYINIRDMQYFPVKQIFLMKDPQKNWSFPTFLEQQMYESFASGFYDTIFTSPLFKFPPLLYVAESWKLPYELVDAVDKGLEPRILLSFPLDVFDITRCLIHSPQQKLLLKPVYYRLCAIVCKEPEHVVSVIRYGDDWYRCSDDVMLMLSKSQMRHLAQKGYVRIPKDSMVERLREDYIQQGVLYTVKKEALGYEVAFSVDSFLYERVDV